MENRLENPWAQSQESAPNAFHDTDGIPITTEHRNSELVTEESKEYLRKSNEKRLSQQLELFKKLETEFGQQSSAIPTTKSQALSQIQSVFSDSQKITYVGMCNIIMFDLKNAGASASKRATASFDEWMIPLKEKIFVYLDINSDERIMIESLVTHGVLAADLCKSLIKDVETSEKEANINDGEPPLDIRYTILSHLFLIVICDGFYDARSRTLLRLVAKYLLISYNDLVTLESFIAGTLRLYDDESGAAIQADKKVIEGRNTKDGANRWLYAGAATLAGGAIIGLTAGLAAPLIGAGFGAALTTFGVTNGAAGIGAFMASSGGIALITSGGVLTGGGMSGLKMMKRTMGIEEFEFIGLSDALRIIAENKEKRRLERAKKGKTATAQKEIEIQNDLADQLVENDIVMPDLRKSTVTEPVGDILWEVNSNSSGDILKSDGPPDNSMDAKKDKVEASLNEIAVNSEEDLKFTSHVNLELDPDIKDNGEINVRQTSVLITVAGWVSYDRDDHIYPFSTLEPGRNGDQYSLIWETKTLAELWTSMSIFATEVATFLIQQGLQATLLPVLLGALTGPLWLIKLTYLLDNPWGNAMTKAQKAGRLLADTLITGVQSNRPVSLVGFSLGARLIYHCLLELADRGAYGLVENVCLLGCPCVSSEVEWNKILSVVSGTVTNGYNSGDTVLSVLYRAATTSYSYVPGLSAQEFPGIVNYDLKEFINGHMEYAKNLPLVLKHVGFEINSETFEDQDAEKSRTQEQEEEQKRLEREAAIQEMLAKKIKEEEDRAAAREKLRLEKEYKAEQKRLIKEAELAEKKRRNAEKAMRKQQDKERKLKERISKETFTKQLSIEELANEELHQMQELQMMMDEYWKPRELPTTLPALEIDSSTLNLNQSIDIVDENSVEIKSEESISSDQSEIQQEAKKLPESEIPITAEGPELKIENERIILNDHEECRRDSIIKQDIQITNEINANSEVIPQVHNKILKNKPIPPPLDEKTLETISRRTKSPLPPSSDDRFFSASDGSISDF